MIAALTALAVLGQAAPPDWKRQAITSEFSVEAPVRLRPLVKNDSDPSLPKGMRYWNAKYQAAVFSAIVMPITEKERKRATSPLETFALGIARPGDGAMTGRRTLTLPGGIRGLQWDQENALLRSRWRAYEFNKTILAASVTWRAKSITPLDMGRFLESMRIRP